MKIAMSSLLYSNYSTEFALKQISEMGYKYIDLGALQNWCHIQPKEVFENPVEMYEKLTRIIENLTLDIVAFNCGLGSEEKEHFEALAKLAAKMKVPVLTLPSGSKDSSVEIEIARLAPLVKIAESNGIQLTIESHVGTITENPDKAFGLLKAIPGLGLTLDISHYYCNNYEREAEKLLPYVQHVHIRDCGRGWENIQLPFGDGFLDLKYWIQLLKKKDYKGNITIEYIDLPDVHFDHIEAATRCAKKCKELVEV